MFRAFAKGQGDQGFNPRSCQNNDSKMVHALSLLNTQYYMVQIKGKWRNPGKGASPSSKPWCCNYLKKGDFMVSLSTVGLYIYMFFAYIYLYI